MSEETTVTAADWIKGISLSILASVIGGASKLAIRKSWMLQLAKEEEEEEEALQQQVPSSPAGEEMVLYNNGSESFTFRSNHHHGQEETPQSPSEGLELLDDEESSSSSQEEEDDENLPIVSQDRMLRQRNSLIARANSFEARSCSGASTTTTPSLCSTPPRRRTTTARHNSDGSSCYGCCCSTLWLAYTLRFSGMIGMTFLNPICCVLAMNYASPSILAPFSGLTLVWIVVLSSPVIGERPSSIQVTAASLIVTGEVIVAVYGDHTNDEGVSVQHVVCMSTRSGLEFSVRPVALTLFYLSLFHH